MADIVIAFISLLCIWFMAATVSGVIVVTVVAVVVKTAFAFISRKR